jgi:dynein heavy chain
VCLTQLEQFIDLYDDVPYEVVHFLSYDVNYGGRVTDDNDRRTIKTILDDFMTGAVLEDGYTFSESPDYISIPVGNRDYYIEQIGKLPDSSEPVVFGMHSNADITSAQEETMNLFYTVLDLLPKSSSGGGKSREEIIGEQAQNVLDRMPVEWDIDTVSKKYPTMYSESMNTVLVQEIIRYNRLLAVMVDSLQSLQKALKGEMVMSADLEKMADRLFTNLVPATWEAVAYPSLMPLAAWVTDLVARCAFLEKWVEEGTPIVFWISGFFFPQAFLTGSLQNYARQSGHPVDAISFAYDVCREKASELTTRPEVGIYITGLFLQGCRWDAELHSLADSRPKELFTSFPPMWLRPEFERVPSEEGVFKCAVYKELTRRGTLSTTGHSTNYVMPVDLPTNVKGTKWTKAGVALFCALNY